MTCQHDFYYYLATNEDGWKCCNCDFIPGEDLGYSAELDVDQIERKIEGILQDLHEFNFRSL